MMYLLAILMPPVYFLVKKRWVAFWISLVLVVASIFLLFMIWLAPLIFIVWGLLAAIAIWDLREKVARQT